MAPDGIVTRGTDSRTERSGPTTPERVAARLRTELARLDPSLAAIAPDPASAHWLGRLLAEVERLVDTPDADECPSPVPHDQLSY